MEESKRTKSKTEFIKSRDRQESEDSAEPLTPGGTNMNITTANEESEDVQAYLNSIVPNNSIKFAKPS